MRERDQREINFFWLRAERETYSRPNKMRKRIQPEASFGALPAAFYCPRRLWGSRREHAREHEIPARVR